MENKVFWFEAHLLTFCGERINNTKLLKYSLYQVTSTLKYLHVIYFHKNILKFVAIFLYVRCVSFEIFPEYMSENFSKNKLNVFQNFLLVT